MIVIIAGMHRSGTSAVAGMLHANGVVMGEDKDFYPPPMKENPKGFYENVRFRRINDEILKRNGYKVKSFDPNIPIVHIIRDEEMRFKMMNLIQYYEDRFTNWGWKDPRTSLTLMSWINVIKDIGLSHKLRFIVTCRPVEEIRKSMLARGNKEKRQDQFLDLAAAYYKRFYDNFIQFDGMLSYLLTFQDLINKTEWVAKELSTFVGTKIEDISFVDKEIARNVS